LETAPGQQREAGTSGEPQAPGQESKQLVVDVRTDADKAAATGQATSAVSTGELPGEFLYFFHPDHLGSTSYVTDDKGAVYEHLQYFPFGETWVQEGQPSQRIPYLFTSRELDEETGLYYFGAKYYDPRTSLWVSADPALEDLLPTGSLEYGRVLPGIGGVYRTSNLSLYNYATHNPIRLTDPDGRLPIVPILAAAWAVVEVALSAYDIYVTGKTLADPEASGAEKAAAVVGTAASIVGPGGGYGTAGKQVAGKIDDATRAVKGAGKADDAAVAAGSGAAGGPTAGKPFSRSVKEEVKSANREANTGIQTCENCGVVTVQGSKTEKGVSRAKNETQVDHIIPKSRGGDAMRENAQVLCRDCNQRKGAK
jgi:RHS repeat-associated protein